MLSISVGVCAYNEEKNIRACLESISAQGLQGFEIIEVLVISSGSTDGTNQRVMEYERIDPRIKLHVQERREGKNSAINLFLDLAKTDILVLVNADNRLEVDSLQALLTPFSNNEVGMAGGHPVPLNPQDTLSGFAVHMLWEMHHRIALVHPKLGELVAFRRLRITLPGGTQSDEDIICMEVAKRGLRTVYAPGAIVYNRGPQNVRDFLKQRTRVNIGERYMRRWFHYEISTWDLSSLLHAYGTFAKDNRHSLHLMFLAIAMEACARTYAIMHVALNRGDKPMWSQVSSTKDLGQ